ncbi:helix-turn-helix transcriptional regulator [Flavobacterium sp.]|uniref:helix-turn-helix domain-containing protein n=1 Tax=Flavobacterium sp. TaxID=239 RepID=UPI00286D6CEC|nr:helix-turn-helix transcriptional regulator [Flavobacterium sp.]
MEKNKNIENFLKHVSEKDSGWLEKAKWRQENEYWLDISFSIAVRVASTLSANKKANIYPKSQVELAEAMGCSAQYVNKLLRGQENLQIETISKIGRILGITLIEVPKIESTKTVQYNSNYWLERLNIIVAPVKTSAPYSGVDVKVQAGENNYALAA